MARRRNPRSRDIRRARKSAANDSLLKRLGKVLPSVNHSIRVHNNLPKKAAFFYTLEDIGVKISASSVATKAYQRITDEGYDIQLNYDDNLDNPVGRTINHKGIIEIFVIHNINLDDVIGTIVHESVHVEYRNKKRISHNTQYEEYRAFVREEVYRNSLNPYIPTRPTIKERLDLWALVKNNYPGLSQGKYPFGGAYE